MCVSNERVKKPALCHLMLSLPDSRGVSTALQEGTSTERDKMCTWLRNCREHIA